MRSRRLALGVGTHVGRATAISLGLSMMTVGSACHLVLGIEPWPEDLGTTTASSGGGGASTNTSSTDGSGGASSSSTVASAGGQGGCDASMCGSDCIDLETSPVHCGVCDRHCFGAACVAGACEPKLLGATVGSGSVRGLAALTDWVAWSREEGASGNVGIVSKRGAAPKTVTMFGSVSALAGSGDIFYAATDRLVALNVSNLALSSQIATRIDLGTSAPLPFGATNLVIDDVDLDGIVEGGTDKIWIGATIADSNGQRAVLSADPFLANQQLDSPDCLLTSTPFRVAVRQSAVLYVNNTNVSVCGGGIWWSPGGTASDLLVTSNSPFVVLAAVGPQVVRKVNTAGTEVVAGFGTRSPRRIVARGDELFVLARNGGDQISVVSASGTAQTPVPIYTDSALIYDIAVDDEGVYFVTIDGVFAIGR